MAFDSFSEFIAMGGYGIFVWLSFGVTAIAMLGIVIESQIANRQLIKQVAQERARRARINAAKENKIR